jgi:hypothetical protein
MTRTELQRRLDEAGIRRDVYQFGGGFPSEMLCLTPEEGRWIVYYSERGHRTGTKSFESEAEFETLDRMPEAHQRS